MGKGLKRTRIIICTLEHFLTISPTEKESTPGQMEKGMMENGCKGVRMDLESGRDSIMTLTWVNGVTIKFGGMECISGQTETNMKVNGLAHSRTDRALIALLTKMFTRVNTKKASLMDMDSTGGRVELCISESLAKAESMAKDPG